MIATTWGSAANLAGSAMTQQLMEPILNNSIIYFNNPDFNPPIALPEINWFDVDGLRLGDSGVHGIISNGLTDLSVNFDVP